MASGQELNEEVVKQLIQAADTGNVEYIKRILQENPQYLTVRDKSRYGGNRTLLHVSAREGQVAVINCLIACKADVNAVDQDGRTALHLAGFNGSSEAIKVLFAAGSPVNATDNDGNTPVHIAAWNGHVEALTVLKSLGADVNIANKGGNTPVHVAAQLGEVEALQVLKSLGADVNIANKDGVTPLLIAVNSGIHGTTKVVKYLINECKVDITHLDQEVQRKINQMLGKSKPESSLEATSESSKVENKQSDSEVTSESSKVEDKPSLIESEKNDEDVKQAYSLALKDGEAKSSSFSIYVLGQEKTGKTCLVASLLDDKFEVKEATHGADVDVCTIFASGWRRVEKKAMPKRLRKNYLCKLKVTAEIKISAELGQSVLKAQNKQQLLQSLPSLPAAVQADLEQAKSAVLINDDDGTNAMIWDFAGQSVYYGLHSMFLKESNVALIVFDASQNLHDPAQGRNTEKDRYAQASDGPNTTGCESVVYWLNSIHSICHKDGTCLGASSKFVPTVFLVATHIDLIGDSEAVEKRMQQIIDQLVDALKDKPEIAKHLAGTEEGLRKALEKNCFFVSNKFRNKKELNRLKAALVEAAQYILEKNHPIVYLNIEKSLLSRNKAAISVAEFHSIAIESGFFATPDSSEFKGALAHFHDKGSILHFPQSETLKDVVVLTPDWLSKLFSYIIVAHAYEVELDYFTQFQRLKSHGLLEEEFVTFMVGKFNKEQAKFGLSLTKEQAIGFAQHFKFISEISSNTYFLEENFQRPSNEKKVFIVPPVLPVKLPDHLKLPEDQNPEARIVYFKFFDGFIPLMVYYQMLSVCINRNMLRKEDLYWVRRRLIKLVLGDDHLYYVSLCEEHGSIRLAITPDEGVVVKSQSLHDRWELIEEFSLKLKEVVSAFMPASDLPQRYVPCGRCRRLHLNLEDIRASEKPLHCVYGRLPEDYYDDLRKKQVTSVTDEAALSGDIDLPAHISQKVPSLKQLVTYLKKVTKDWEIFGICLLPDEKEHLLEEIKCDHEVKGINSCKMELFRRFLQCGVNTWEIVVNALENSDHMNIAKHLKRELIKTYL